MKLTADVGGKEEVVDLGVVERPIAAAPIAEDKVGDALDDRELADAKKHGIVKETQKAPTPEERAATDKAAKDKADLEKAEADKLAGKKPDPQKPEQARADLLNENPDPQKEAERIKDFNPNEKALYHERKKAIRRAQRAEARISELEKELEEARKPKADPVKGEDGEDLLDGKPKDPAAPAPETPEQKQARLLDRRKHIVNLVSEQERDFKITHPDFDQVYDFTQQIIEAVENKDEAKLAAWFPDPMYRKGVKSLVRDFEAAVAYPDHPELPRQAPEVAYEIGNLHPERQKPPAAAAKSPAEPPPAVPAKDVTAEGQPPSSAALSSGSQANPKKIIDMTEEEYLGLSDEQALGLKKRFPKEFEALMRKFS